MEGFTTNFTATNLIELLNLQSSDDSTKALPVTAVLKCENEIDDNPAATKCLDCNFYYCEECTVTHKTQRVTKNHKLATLAELKEGEAKQLEHKHYCSDHEGEELKLYCRTCQEVICRDCAIVTHKQHDYTFIKDVREELTKKMESLLASVDGKEAEYQSLLDSIHQASERETQKLATEEAKVKAFFDKHIAELQLLIDGLQGHKATVLSDLATASAVHTKQLLADEESIQFSRTQLTNTRTFTQQQLSSASNTNLAMMSKQVIKQLQVICKHKFKIVNALLRVVSLSEDNPLNSKIESLSAGAIANAIVYQPTNPALLGKNTFSIRMNNVPAVFKLQPAVTVTLSSGDSCPVNITPSGNNKWSVKYFVTRYPQPGVCSNVVSDDELSSDDERSTSQPGACGKDSSDDERSFDIDDELSIDEQLSTVSSLAATVKVSVKINGVQAKDSPMKLQLNNELAVGTRVEQASCSNQQGTVVSYQHYQQYYNSHTQYRGYNQGYGHYHRQPAMEHPSTGYAFVQWNTGTQRTNINELKVLPE